MDRCLEVFEEANRLREAGLDTEAIPLYREALILADDSGQIEKWWIHHMLGVSLINTIEFSMALKQFALAEIDMPNSHRPALDRDRSRAYLRSMKFDDAMEAIELSLDFVEPSDLAERGASLGLKARILRMDGDSLEALEMFGTADWLLQRSDNRHYELCNLVHLIAGMVDQEPESLVMEPLIARAQKLAAVYGRQAHQDQIRHLVQHWTQSDIQDE